MAVIELSLHKNYVPDWQVWAGIREIIQNALDEHDDGNTISIEHKDGWLRVRNDGSHLNVQALLIGFTTKAEDAKKRGQKGEGLALAMLALTRSGFDMEVRTPTETWKPFIAKSDKWENEVLFVQTRKVKSSRSYTEVSVQISEAEWGFMKRKFLDLHECDQEDVVDTERGQILLDPAYIGQVYVKGIWVEKLDLRYGYNLYYAGLDRDRTVVKSFDLEWAIGHIYSEAIARHPKKMGKIAFDLLEEDSTDAQALKYMEGEEAKKVISGMFKEEHGEKAVPVDSIGASAEMESFGRLGVMAPRIMRDIVSNHIDTPEKVRVGFESSAMKTYSWPELQEGEQATLNRVAERLGEVFSAFRDDYELCTRVGVNAKISDVTQENILDMFSVVDFHKDGLQGLWMSKGDTIQVAKKTLRSYPLALKVVIHEFAHKLSRERDEGRAHTYMIEDIWTAMEYIASVREEC